MSRFKSVLLAVVLGIVAAVIHQAAAPFQVKAHSGGLDSQGCHNDRQRGGYHCHRGPLAGQAFASSADAAAALARSSQPTRPIPTTPLASIPLATVKSAASMRPPSTSTSGLFESFNRQTRILVLRDLVGARLEFALRDDTTLLVAGEMRFDDFLEIGPKELPWTSGQEITVQWRPSADRLKRVVVSIR